MYAVAQSVSSMSDAKPPEHRRYRLIFLFDNPIESVEHYNQNLLTLAKEFPIIPAVERSPAQPVFGNAREEYNQVHICGNVLTLADYPYTPPVESKDKSQPRLDFDETLESYLKRHGIEYTHTKEAGKFYVNCPYKRSPHRRNTKAKLIPMCLTTASGVSIVVIRHVQIIELGTLSRQVTVLPTDRARLRTRKRV